MPSLTIATGIPAGAAAGAAAAAQHSTSSDLHQKSSRDPSPSRPPVSPITPTLAPAQLPATAATSTSSGRPRTDGASNPSPSKPPDPPDFAQGRPAFAHSQPDQVGILPPPVVPIAFDDNPDVLALKSAISILQLQRARATADMQTLSRAKAAALADPGAFVADLVSGRVGMEGDPLMFPGAGGGAGHGQGHSRASGRAENGMVDHDSSSSSSDDDEDDDTDGDEQEEDEEAQHIKTETASSPDIRFPAAQENAEDGNADGDVAMAGTSAAGTESQATPSSADKIKKKKNKKRRKAEKEAAAAAAAAWRKLPKPQNVVRCPPVNWAQYAVVGESLDKLHAEQVAAPSLGAPAVLGPGGAYEFKAGAQKAPANEPPPRRLVGIAAPYTPGRDKLEKKAKGAKR
ncbi:hypothetical protein B0T24DRAFT_604782 [Lasiosphaeria ovina]|uniref:Uncharacterized protein n=1 Tax=Lasiosphaeria ovina TaxID=92902 RepID=A0AAE0NKY4_9PEZI|nr:hypothetical protein B0T24DRAFT_604782 [Lasiosphaeria ovina]